MVSGTWVRFGGCHGALGRHSAVLDSITVDIAAGVHRSGGSQRCGQVHVATGAQSAGGTRHRTGVLAGHPLPDMDAPALRRRIGLVAQQPVLLAERVLEKLRVGQPRLTGQTAEELPDRVGLAETFAKRRSAELSGGQAQRMCLARALPPSLKYCCWTNRLRA